ncbi:trichohyalin-like isoform X2 [Sander lucioperca]|uniref:trichohyalin-like isoform X2 n=1 Tax=Sander lucioperca TaxID=283035 RepID=UPI00125DEB82|nr:trichohyalin-like isoform X2 [Sander lucioperca]
MLHEKDRLSQCGAFTVLVFHTIVFLTLIHLCRGQSEVIAPSQPIVAFVGEDIILPCHLEPAMNAFDITTEWARPDLDPRFVLVWRDGVELESKKHSSYRGRTSLFTEELKHGNVSLKLSKVKISDEGTYRCFIPVLARASTVQLVVGAVSPPVIQSSKNLSAVVLQCESEGWYPEPEVLWLDGEGNLLSAGPTETLRGPDGLYTVSSRVAVEKRHNNNFTCRVQQQNINQTRETHVHVPDEFFMVPSTPTTPSTPSSPSTADSPGVITGSVIGCALLLLIAAVVFVVWKWRQKKFKNKRRSLEDGAEHTEEEKKVTSKRDNTGFQVLMEPEGESAPLMAGREEENNVMRVEDKDASQSEHKDETQQNQLETKPDMDRAEGERDVTSIKNENVPLIPTEVEKHQKQDMTGKEVKHEWDEGEGEQTMKPVEEDSGRSLVLVAEGPKEQLQNVHADQEEEKEETRQEPMTDVRKKEPNIKKKREKKENGKKLQENQREGRQQEVERQKQIQPEEQKRKEREKDKMEPQTEKDNQHVLQDRKQDTSKAGHEDKKGKDQEENQSYIMTATQRKAENQTEKINESLEKTEEEKMEKERKLQSEEQDDLKRDKEKIETKTQKRDVNQQVLDTSKQEAEHKDKKGQEGEQSNITTMTERKTESQNVQISEKAEQREIKRDQSENKLTSVSREVMGKPDLKTHQETAGRQNQELQEENQLQTEKQQQETKEQPEESSKVVKVEWKERGKEGLESDEGADIDETQKTSKEIRREEQAEQHLDVKEGIPEKIEVFMSSHLLAERGGECQGVQQQELIENNRRPQIKARRRGKQHKREEEPNVAQQQTVCRKRSQEEDSKQTQERSRKLKKLKKLNGDEIKSEDKANMKQDIIDEEMDDVSYQQDRAFMCQEDQQEEDMEL